MLGGVWESIQTWRNLHSTQMFGDTMSFKDVHAGGIGIPCRLVFSSSTKVKIDR